MNSLHTLRELRDTLDGHAAGIHDDAAAARTAAVRGRASAVRRRRNAVAAGATALVVAALAVVSALPGDRNPRPADREVLGELAPETFTSLGWTYRFAGSAAESDASQVTMRLGRSDEPRLVSWTTAGEDQGVVVRRGDGNRSSFRGPQAEVADFGDFVLLPAGYAGRVTVRADQPGVGMASYEIDESAPPEGVGEGLQTFRQDAAGGRLIGATFADRGAAEVSVTFTVPPSGEVRLSDSCSNAPDGAVVHVGLTGEQGDLTYGPGCGPDFDPGAGWVATPAGRPGERLTARLWVTDGEDGPPVAADDLRLGLAAYAPPAPVTRLAGWPVTELKEYDGHLWRYRESERGRPGRGDIGVSVGYGGPRLLALGAFRRAGSAGVRFDGDGEMTVMNTGAGATVIGVLDPARDGAVDDVALRVTRGQSAPDVELGIALFEQVD